MTDNNNYQAHAFHDSFAKGRASGTLLVSEASIRFRNDQSSISLPMSNIVFKVGGASDRLIYISHPKYPEWTLYTADRDLLDNAAFKENVWVRSQAQKIKTKRFFNWALVAFVCSLFVLVPICTVVFMESITRSVALQIPAQWEAELGEKAFAQYQFDHDLLEEKEAKALLGEMVAPLLSQITDERYNFTIVISDDTTLNAFALPGGYVVINAGLIMKAKSADELLGVLAHELSHVTQQHGIRNVIAASGTFLVVQALIGDAAGVTATLAGSIPFLLNQQYSRGFETEADEKGVELLIGANINPHGILDFFEQVKAQEQEMLEEIEDDTQRDITEAALGFLSTHPATDDRISHIKQLLSRLDKTVYKNLNSEFLTLQTAVKNFVTKEDEA